MTIDIEKKVVEAKRASIRLSRVENTIKNTALKNMAKALDSNRKAILEANRKDLELAEKLLRENKLSHALIGRLKVNESKIDEMIAGIQDVIKLEDPTGKTLQCLELDRGLILCKVSCPIGLIGVIFESRPDVVPQVMALCLKSGNATIFKGGSEARTSNRIIFNILKDAIKNTEGIPQEAFQLMETREEVMDILSCDSHIDLLIPRGSNAFVKYIQDNTKIPVLGHADGICHVYVDNEASIDTAIDVCFDSKVQYPAVCNAMETMLVHICIADGFLPLMLKQLADAGVELRLDEISRSIADKHGIASTTATEEDWHTEYNDLILSVKIVDSMEEAIDHINNYGSHHTDAIVTENPQKKKEFSGLVDSSSVMLNASTRFADGFRYGKGAEVGISTNKIHARGPVGMEGLVIYKYILTGNGDKVADFSGPNAKSYTHRELNLTIEDIL